MTEFIGSRISLISKRDIRYVGTLHEISSENSTVALEQVVSYGTEGRRPDAEVPPSLDNIYEYIVFRGSDVKDLRIEKGPKENEQPKPPEIPDDPAILDSTRKPTPATSRNGQTSKTPATQTQVLAQQVPQQQESQRQLPPHIPQPYPYHFPPPNQRFGPQGFPPGPPGHGFPGMPYGGPAGWYPPYGFPHGPPGHFPPPHMPIGPLGHHQGQHQRQQVPSQSVLGISNTPSMPTPAITTTTTTTTTEQKEASLQSASPKLTATVKLPSSSTTPKPLQSSQNAPPSPYESKPNITATLAPPAIEDPVTAQASLINTKAIPTGPKSGRIVPAVPLPSPAVKIAHTIDGSTKSTTISSNQDATTQPTPAQNVPTANKTLEEANRDARAAVAAAMAKLPMGQKKQVDDSAVDNLTRRVHEMKTSDSAQNSRQPGTGGFAAGHRGGRGVLREGREQPRKIEIPRTDYDFESANAKFNKQDLVKEAIAIGSPLNSPDDHIFTNGKSTDSVTNGSRKGSESTANASTSVAGYNKSSSFFDDISSEIKDRAEREDTGQKLGGREFRNEERQKNLETFGQGSVDNGYRYGRGSGRGRGRGFGRGRNSRRGYDGRGGGRGGIRPRRSTFTSDG